jgi:HPt (histidine-containing phosphotransfer) domain-containing protein
MTLIMSQSALPQDLDLSMLHEIADGSNEFLVESIDMFLEHTPQMVEMISTGIAANDWTTVAAAAHKLKPNLGFFGMPISQAIAQEVELMAKAGAPDLELLKLKFDEMEAIIAENSNSLVRIKADLEE